jgi:hypothetical protein
MLKIIEMQSSLEWILKAKCIKTPEHNLELKNQLSIRPETVNFDNFLIGEEYWN